MIICGIDPGLSGGIAFFDNEKHSVHAEKAPIFKIKTGIKTKRFLDMWQLISIIEDHDPDHVYIEKATSYAQARFSKYLCDWYGLWYLFRLVSVRWLPVY